MKYYQSELLSPPTSETQGLCEGIPLRRHRDPFSEEIGALRAQRDWMRLVGPIQDYEGGLGPRYSFMRVTVPEALSERLEVISYANEFAFLYDDVMENLDLEEVIARPHSRFGIVAHHSLKCRKEKIGVLSTFRDLKEDTGPVVRGEKQMQSQILAEMMRVDPERAVTAMKAWSTFVDLAAARDRTQPFTSLDDYLPYRIIDAGERLWYGTVTFAMGLTIPEHEIELSKRLTMPAFAHLSLTNDLFSWEKERAAAEKAGAPQVVNAIWVLMNERSISEQEAKQVCREKIRSYAAGYVRIVHDIKRDEGVSEDLKSYVEAIQFSVSGNLIWSLHCPRYR